MRLIRKDQVICVGSELRDEFCCPITQELFRDPVIAADGHTYDRCSIEKWLSTHDTSPKTRQKLCHTQLIPNLNLKRLIDNLLLEGGQGLFEKNNQNKLSSKIDQDPQRNTFAQNKYLHQFESDNTYSYHSEKTSKIAIVREKVVTFKCIVPNDSNWMDKNFQVFQNGALGGRKRPSDLGKRDFVQFTETIVSRRHFEVLFDEKSQNFGIRDLGSAAGTFWRLNYGISFLLQHETVFLIGKHQLMSLYPDSGLIPNNLQNNQNENDESEDNQSNNNSNSGQSDERNDSVKDKTFIVEQLFKRINLDDTIDDINLRNNTKEFKRNIQEQKDDINQDISSHLKRGSLKVPRNVAYGETECQSDLEFGKLSDERLKRQQKSIKIKCIAPEKSPLEGSIFDIDHHGATLGRKLENTIPFIRIEHDNSIVGLDSAISGRHARIIYNEQQNGFTIIDGTEARPSTNGTWVRLGRGQTESEVKQLNNGLEVLIGVLWFRVHINEVVFEVQLDSENAII